MRIFQKNNHTVISLGALSNMEISDFFFSGIVNWEVQIGGIPHAFIDELVIVYINYNKELNYFTFFNIFEAYERAEEFSVI